MNTKLAIAALIATSGFMTGCATPHVVQAVKTTDSAMTCAQIDAELADADRFRSDAQKEKGMTGTNVAAVIFFWPAMIGTYSNANEAIAAADSRKIHLSSLSAQKKCGEKSAESSGLSTKAARSEKELTDLKALLDKGVITKSEYDTQRAKLISAM